MAEIKFIKEPGYVYDLFFLFIYHFNRDYCLSNVIMSKEEEFYDRNLFSYDTISDDLLPFFYIKKTGKCFMTDLYFDGRKDAFISSYDLPAIQTALTDHDTIVTQMLQYYFRDLGGQALETCKRSMIALSRVIRQSDYSDRLKTSLYSFFIDPVPVIQKLSYELMSKGFQLTQQYEKKSRQLNEIQNHFDIDYVLEKWKQCEKRIVCLEGFQEVYVTFCTINKFCLKALFLRNQAVLILGMDYKIGFDYCIAMKNVPELDVFGNAIAEKNRVEILDLILRKGEITIKDVEQEMKLTGTNAYYHLSLMIKANMLKTRNQGRTVLYSLNPHCFAVVQDMLNKYINEGEEKE